MRLRKYLTLEVLGRVAVDVLVVNLAFLMALVVRLLWLIGTDPSISAREQLTRATQIYEADFWLLTVISIVVYSISGFYSRGRFYQGRFKVLVVVEAVSLSYLLFVFALYLAEAKAWLPQPPRVALVIGWLLNLAGAIGVRLWAMVWRLVMTRESPALRISERSERIHHVLVIGGAGYIGSVLCRQLLQQGYSVRVLDALLYGKESIAELLSHPRFSLIEGDSRDVGAVFQAILDMDAVVHLGELVGDPACALDEKLTMEINLAATRMIAEAARGYGIKRFVYASSCSVYGAGGDILDERSVLNPVSLYARSKISSEQALLALSSQDFHPVILRFATVYGLSPRPRFDLVINLLTAKAVCDGEITIFGGDQWRPFVHVADVAQAITRCLEAPLDSVKAQVFNVGSDTQNYTIAHIGELIHRLIPEARLVNQGDDRDKRDYHVSFAKIRNQLRFLPRYTVEDGVHEIAAALRDGSIQDYRDSRYSNIKTLSVPTSHSSIRSKRISGLYAVPPLGEVREGAVTAEVSPE
jgi:nucleoside-diphosphate-sugar epimerase